MWCVCRLQVVIVVLGVGLVGWVGHYGLALVWVGQVWLLSFAECLRFMSLLNCRVWFL